MNRLKAVCAWVGVGILALTLVFSVWYFNEYLPSKQAGEILSNMRVPNFPAHFGNPELEKTPE